MQREWPEAEAHAAQAQPERWVCMFGRRCLVCVRASSLRGAQGKELGGATEGILCIKQAWPATIRTIKGDHKRFEMTYFSTYKARFSKLRTCAHSTCQIVIVKCSHLLGFPSLCTGSNT